MNTCLFCGVLIPKRNKYCNNKCQSEYQYKEKIDQWIRNKKNFIRSGGTSLPSWMRKYLMDKAEYKCSECGWSEINTFTQTIPLDVDHIDGDAYNNEIDNLRVLCPNCHSLKKTFKNSGRRISTRKYRNKPL
jgi:predicted restriction endonuclease